MKRNHKPLSFNRKLKFLLGQATKLESQIKICREPNRKRFLEELRGIVGRSMLELPYEIHKS